MNSNRLAEPVPALVTLPVVAALTSAEVTWAGDAPVLSSR
jgi:hypothetical protein